MLIIVLAYKEDLIRINLRDYLVAVVINLALLARLSTQRLNVL
jgi:hypothetical protein